MADEPQALLIDRNNMTLGDLDDFETVTGIEAAAFLDGLGEGNQSVPAKALIALMWISKRKADPAFTLADARDIPISELQILAESAPVPTRAVRRAAAKTTKKPAVRKSAAAKR